MKKQWYYLLLMAIATLFMTSCDDDEGSNIIDVPIYGFQATGTATDGAVYVIDQVQMAEPSSDYNVKEAQTGMNYGIFWLKAGEMSLKNVTVSGEVTYGVSNATNVEQSAEVGTDEDMITYMKGDLDAAATTAVTVASEGLYYIITDEVNMKVWLMKIDEMEINATGDVATLDAGGSATGCTFSVDGVELRSAFKMRINKAWKYVFEDVPFAGASVSDFPDDHARPVISYGAGATDGALAPDGGDISIETEKLLNFTFTWNPAVKGIAGITYATEEGEDLPAAEFPEALYMTGASVGTGAWSWVDNAVMLTPVHSNPHLFWNVQWLEPGVADAGFKVSAELDWGPAFGVDPGSVVDGVYAKGTENVPEVATAGYYTIVVNYEDETIEVNPAMIYGIGDAFGAWDAATAAYMFTLDATNKVMVSPATTADASMRMHVAAKTLTTDAGVAVDWWQAEFNVIDGKIEYRGTGDDQAAVASTAGQVVTLDFVAGTGTIQ